MILTKEAILKEIKKKNIVVTPFDSSSVGPGSIDLTLSSTIRVFDKKKDTVRVDEQADYKSLTKVVDIKNGYTLKPGQLVMGITEEKITLAGNICGWLNSRSRFARIGLMSHITAPFIAPGVSNQQVLEIYNASPHPLKLIPGVKICQLIFERCEGKAQYKGKFKSQSLL